MGKILVVDDSRVDRSVLKHILSSLAHEVVEAETGEAGVAEVEASDYDLVLLDFVMPGMSGMDALRQIKVVRPQLPVVLVTAVEEADGTIEAMSFGAYDYLTKPVDRQQFVRVVSEALKANELMKVMVEVGSVDEPGKQRERIVGRSPTMWELYKRVGQAAASDATVLITGESGTGKELVARAIYQHGPRSEREFVVVNCAALPEGLLESELFGHEEGAFTGAHARHIGKFERANGGTIFLDEIGEMGPLTQPKILRALQERTFERVGGSEPISCDIRLLAATNKNLQQEIVKGTFREDLYYRLNVLELRVPPLRDRKEDIPELCTYLLNQAAEELGKPPAVLSPEAMKALLDRDWPGNVRELRNVIARATVASPTSIILPEHLSPPRHQPASPAAVPAVTRGELDRLDGDLYERVKTEMDRHLVRYALDRTDGNQVHAAKLLGVSRNFLRGRIQELGITVNPGDATDAAPES